MGRAVTTARWKGNTPAADQPRRVLVLPGAGHSVEMLGLRSPALLVAASSDRAWDGDAAAGTGKSIHVALEWRGPAL